MTSQIVKKAIIPVAGLGTRFLPATKAIPKEMMTLVDRPLVQYAVDEARSAGIEQFIFVTARRKTALEDHFDRIPDVERMLAASGKLELLKELDDTVIQPGSAVYVRQDKPLGLGHAIWCARSLISNEPFAVLLPDDVIDSTKPCLQQMMEAYAKTGGNMIAAMDVKPDQVPSYGIVKPGRVNGPVVTVDDLVEKPRSEDAPSTLAVIGRYILSPKVLDALENPTKGVGGEIQLTDAIAKQVESDGVYALRFDGRRYDCGSKAQFLQATVAFGLARPDLRDELLAFLKDIESIRQR